MAPSRITQAGLRVAFRHMISKALKNTPAFFHLKRNDENLIEVSLTMDNARINEDDTPFFQVVVTWDVSWLHETRDAEMFIDAMNRFMESTSSSYTVDFINEELKDINGEDAIPRCFDTIKKMLDIELCCCKFAMVEENYNICLTCIAGLEDKDLSKFMCGVCHETNFWPINKTRCCKQWIHRSCHNKCGTRCPFCRRTNNAEQEI